MLRGVRDRGHDLQHVQAQGAGRTVRLAEPQRPRHFQHAEAAAGRGAVDRQFAPLRLAVGAQPQRAAEGVRIGHGQRALASGDLELDAPQRGVEAEDALRGGPRGEVEQRRDVRGHVHGERLPRLRSRPGRPAGAAPARGGRHPRDRAEEGHQRGEVVGADVEQRAGARLVEEGRVRVPGLGSEPEHGGGGRDRRADGAGAHRAHRRLDAGAEERVGRVPHEQSAFGGLGEQLLARGRDGGERLFAVDVLARAQRRRGDLGVGGRDREVDDDLHLGQGEDRVEAARDGHAVLARRRGGAVGVQVGDAEDAHVGEGAEGPQVLAADDARADDGDADGAGAHAASRRAR